MKLSRLSVFVCLVIMMAACKKNPVDNAPPIISSFAPASGATGATVIITGSNFSNSVSANEVLFNGINAQVTKATASELTVIVPEGATTGKISVKKNGATAVSTNDFTVIATAPVLSGFTPDHGPAGTQVEITGSHFTAATEVYFGAVKATEVVYTNAGKLTAKVPADAVTAKIKVKTAGLEAISNNDFTVIPVLGSFAPTHGEPGSIITLTGTGFTSTVEVFLNGTPIDAGDYVSRNPGKVEVKVPGDAKGGAITIKQDGLTYQFTGSYEVTNIWVKMNSGFADYNYYSSGISFLFDNKVYVGLGTDANGAAKNNFMVYDIAANTWATGPAIEPALLKRSNATAIVYNGKVYIGNGSLASPFTFTKDWYEFDPINGAWKKINDFANDGLFLTTFVVGNKMYAGQGSADATIYEYDAVGQKWNTKIVVNVLRFGAMSFVINDVVYTGGGKDASFSAVNSFISYSINDNGYMSSPMAPLPATWASNTIGKGCSFNSKGYYLTSEGVLLNYDPAANTWTEKRNLPLGTYTNLLATGNEMIALSKEGEIYRYILSY